ncbi:MAG: hypothetical protein D6718_05385 [Acidobacteria bacterium]|nr:MAG: hypothetical protein D6718_05385 [Acidobacteriota bacterium]
MRAFDQALPIVALLAAAPAAAAGHLQHYGFAVVDCGWDDPHDAEPRTRYTDEVDCFTDTAQLCVYDSSERVAGRIRLMNLAGILPILHVQGVLFETTETGVRLRPDYVERWNRFRDLNASALSADRVGAFYLVDEPVLNGLPPGELAAASDLVDADYPEIPGMVIEAADTVGDLVVPPSMDWVGFDEYGIYDPGTDPRYQEHLATLKARRSTPEQRIVMIMDAQWRPEYLLLGWLPETMAEVAANYHAAAEADPDVVALIGYLWPGGLDLPEHLGARDLPENVLDEYHRIGRSILGPRPDCPVSHVLLFDPISTYLVWDPVPDEAGAVYDVTRGLVSSLGAGPLGTDLGPLVCIEDDSPDRSSETNRDAARPPPEDAFFYLVRSEKGGTAGSWGTDTSGGERGGEGGCPPVP